MALISIARFLAAPLAPPRALVIASICFIVAALLVPAESLMPSKPAFTLVSATIVPSSPF